MVVCFVYDCNHHSDDGRCSMFRFPQNLKSRWERLCRRGDRRLGDSDRICSCHFKDGLKSNGPTEFEWSKGKRFDFPEIESRTAKRCKKCPSEEPSTSNAAWKPPVTKRDDVDIEDEVHPPLAEVQHDHSYYTVSPTGQAKLKGLMSLVDKYQKRVLDLESELRQLRLSKRTLTLDDIKHQNHKVVFYTSLHLDVFTILVGVLQRFQLNYHQGWRVTTISLQDQLLMTLMKLRLGAKDLDLADRFGVGPTTVSNIFHTILHALHEILFEGILDQGMPSQLKCKGSMPASFDDFASARAAMDATEITQDVPGNLNYQNDSYSHYKSRHTVKAVTCVAPNAAITYVSDLYPGSVSDVAIVQHSKMLEQFVPGDLILADKGFTIFSQLPKGVSLNIPPFLTGKSHFSKQEAELCFKIGKARIHVERANERIKNYEILDHIPASLRPLSTKIFQVCCCLVNFQDPLLKEIAEKYEM